MIEVCIESRFVAVLKATYNKGFRIINKKLHYHLEQWAFVSMSVCHLTGFFLAIKLDCSSQRQINNEQLLFFFLMALVKLMLSYNGKWALRLYFTKFEVTVKHSLLIWLHMLPFKIYIELMWYTFLLISKISYVMLQNNNLTIYYEKTFNINSWNV